MKFNSRVILFAAITGWLLHTHIYAQTNISAVWANNGEDKVTQDEIRASTNSQSVINSVWDGSKVSIFGAKNEVVAFNLILEAANNQASNITIQFDSLSGPNNASISSIPADENNLFNWVSRNIELFYIRYLQIKGLSILSYTSYYDERHAPERFRRPFDPNTFLGTGSWEDRPDHDKFYPDIAVPLELEQNFSIEQENNQSIWVDIFIPKKSEKGLYHGNIHIKENDQSTHIIPVELTVYDFELPDIPSAKTMIFLENGDIETRYNPFNESEGVVIRNRHFLIAHRHKFSLIDDGYNGEHDYPPDEWHSRLDGSLFTQANGYDGPGIGVGNNVYSIGTYSSWRWSWDENDHLDMQHRADNWVNWFTANSPQTEYFLYLIDESDNFDLINKWIEWLHNNPGVGKNLKILITVPLLDAFNDIPDIDIPTTGYLPGHTPYWEAAYDFFRNDPLKKIFAYNGGRPYDGSYATEDDGVALRVNGWAQYKRQFNRWFYWAATYYNDFQGGRGETNVFQNAHTFGGFSGFDPILGETGWNHTNGDGVLFYPGTDAVYPSESYQINGPIASLRLKQWRRGIQDVDYLTLAAQKNPNRVDELVNQMIPKILWEYGVDDINDPTWVRTDISWSTNPDVWEEVRKEMAELIAGYTFVQTGKKVPCCFTLNQNYPNPFNASTVIKFHLQKCGTVTLKIYNLSGQLLDTLVEGFNSAGINEVKWNAEGLSSGIYFYRLHVDNYSETKKFILLR